MPVGAWLPLLVVLGAPPEAEVVSTLTERGFDPATLEIERRQSLSRPGLELLRIRARPCGVSTARPVARAIVDRTGERVAWAEVAPSPPAPTCGTPRHRPSDAAARVAASGLAGSAGATATAAVPGWVSTGETWRLVWRVDPPADLSVPTDPVFVVDDETGAVRRWSDRVRSAKVRVYPTNPIATPATEVRDLLTIDPSPVHLEGPLFAAANCIEPDSGDGWCHRERTATPDMAGDFVYPEPDLGGPEDPQDAFAEASGYYHLDRFFAWLEGMGVDQLGCHAEGDVVEIVVNRRTYQNGEWEAEDNAFYTGSCGASTLMMGQGAHDFAYDGDIVYHELSHAVIELLAGEDLGQEQRRDDALLFDAGAIDEGVADFLAAAFTHDPLVAEYAFPTGGRSLDNDFRCPRDLTGEIHADGQLIGAALWDAYGELGDPLVPVVLDGLAMIEIDTSFEEFAAILETLTHEALGADAAASLVDAFSARGMIACPRVVDFDAFAAGGVHEDLGLPRLLQVRSPRMGRVYAPTPPPPLQWRIEMPEEADTATLRFSFETAYQIEQNVALGVKHGAPIEFGYAVDGIDVSVDADTDEVVLGGDDGELSFSAEPGSTAYAAMFHLGTGDPVTDRWLLLYGFELEFSCAAGDGACMPADGETGGTGDTGAGSGDDGGCGCASSRPSPALWSVVVMVGVGLRRRRRFTRPAGERLRA